MATKDAYGAGPGRPDGRPEHEVRGRRLHREREARMAEATQECVATNLFGHRPLKSLSGMSLSQVCHNHAYFHVGDGKLLDRYCMETRAFGSWPMSDKPEVTLDVACSYLELKAGDGLWKFHTAYLLAHPEIYPPDRKP